MTTIRTNCTIRTSADPTPVEDTVTKPVIVPDPGPTPEELTARADDAAASAAGISDSEFPEGDPDMTWTRAELNAWCVDAGLDGADDLGSKADVLALIEGE